MLQNSWVDESSLNYEKLLLIITLTSQMCNYMVKMLFLTSILTQDVVKHYTLTHSHSKLNTLC